MDGADELALMPPPMLGLAEADVNDLEPLSEDEQFAQVLIALMRDELDAAGAVQAFEKASASIAQSYRQVLYKRKAAASIVAASHMPYHATAFKYAPIHAQKRCLQSLNVPVRAQGCRIFSAAPRSTLPACTAACRKPTTAGSKLAAAACTLLQW
jgi:hypothetical protein